MTVDAGIPAKEPGPPAAAGRILFVDDDPSLRTVVAIALTKDGHQVDLACSGEEALARFAGENYDLVIQDVRMPGMHGLELLERLRLENPLVPVVVMTAYSTWDIAVEAMRLGAFDYLKKPFDNDVLRNLSRRAIAHGRVTGRDEVPSRLVGTSPAMQEIQAMVRRVARNDSTVLLEGESGSGKELVAALLHAQSSRHEGPFVAVNCGGFSETLLESELFGHVKGAFTGAVADKRGLLELGDGGTFFLDELGEMSLTTQVRLLRVLETRSFYPVGGTTPARTDVRFIAATNRNLQEMVASGAFREDLYYRLNVIPIRVPSLRERREDIPLLAGYFLSLYSERFGKKLSGFDVAAMDAMLSYAWPGNVRELQNAVQRSVLLTEGETVGFREVFPSWTAVGGAAGSGGDTESPPRISLAGGVRNPPRRLESGGGTAWESAGSFAADSAGGDKDIGGAYFPVEIGENFDLEKHLEEIEAEYIRQALARTGHNLTQAAELLGITFRSIRYKVKKLKL